MEEEVLVEGVPLQPLQEQQLEELRKKPDFRPERFVRETICKMILASVGSHEEKQRRARQVYVLKDVLGPLVTDGFVGVCCKSI